MRKLLLLLCAGLFLLFLTGIAYTYYHFNSSSLKLKSQYPIYRKNLETYDLVDYRPDFWIKLDEVSEVAKMCIVLSEDWAFYEHLGIDINQLKIVLEDFLNTQQLSRGASTITQQLAKNIFLSPKRTITRKVKEIIYAFFLEKNFSKDELLEIYLNIIELGHDIYGIKEATSYYFNKSPSKLSAREGAFLAMLLPSPKKYSISFYQNKLTDFAMNQIDSILIKLRQAKVITEEQRLSELNQKFDWEEVSLDYLYDDEFIHSNESF